MTDENEDAINAAGSWDSEWTFYAQKDKTATDATGSPTVSFPAAGARDVWSGRVPVASGGIINVGGDGNYWASVPEDHCQPCLRLFHPSCSRAIT